MLVDIGGRARPAWLAASVIALGLVCAGCKESKPFRVTVALGQTCDEMEAFQPGLGAFCERDDEARKLASTSVRVIDPKTRRALFLVDDAAVELAVSRGGVHSVAVKAGEPNGTVAERQADVRRIVASFAGSGWECLPADLATAIADPRAFEHEEWTEGRGDDLVGYAACRVLRAAGAKDHGWQCDGPSGWPRGSTLHLSLDCSGPFAWNLHLWAPLR